MPYISKNQVRMHDTDMAGRLYFPRQFRFVNDALEDLFESEGVNFLTVFNQSDFFVVIVHCEANYFAHLMISDKLEIHLSVERIGTTSFTLLYQIYRLGEVVGTAKTVHVSIDSKTYQKIPLPSQVITILEKYTIGT